MADPSETTQITRRQALEDVSPDAQTAELVGAIRELSARVGNLQAEVQSLRAQSRALPTVDAEPAGWDDTRTRRSDSLLWVRALDAPSLRAPAVPRLLLELVFLVAVAVGAAIAELDLAEIAVVMAAAWSLVALAEWTGARAARRRAEAVYAPLHGFSAGYPSDPTWFASPLERKPAGALEVDEDTQTKLPAPESS